MTQTVESRGLVETVSGVLALPEIQDYIEACLARVRSDSRAVAICGHGRAGKDTAADFLAPLLGWPIAMSMSEVAAPLVATGLGLPVTQAFAERHANRMYWFEFLNELRRQKGWDILARLAAGANLLKGESTDTHTLLVGIRNGRELYHARKSGLLQACVWIENPRVPLDPTLEYGRDACDFIVENTTTIQDFHFKLRNLVQAFAR